MYKFIICSFLVLGWGFWELSGGSDFETPELSAGADQILATYDVVEGSTVVRSRLTASGSAPAPTEQSEVQQAALLVEEQPTAEDVDDTEVLAALTSGVAALTQEPETEAYSPTTTSAISVQPVAAPAIPSRDVRKVDANRVNMRGGPSTDFQVLDRLNRGDVVQILDNPGDGWVQLRVQLTGQVGWMAERLLTPASN